MVTLRDHRHIRLPTKWIKLSSFISGDLFKTLKFLVNELIYTRTHT